MDPLLRKAFRRFIRTHPSSRRFLRNLAFFITPHQVFVLLLFVSRNGFISRILAQPGPDKRGGLSARVHDEVVVDAVSVCLPQFCWHWLLPVLSYSFRNDPELCDVVRASESAAASVCSETVRPVSTTPTSASPTLSSFSPNSPSRGSEIVEMKAVDNSAALPPIPNTPVDKL